MSSPARTLSARTFFSKKGILSRRHKRYEFRAGQLEMAEAVEAALADERHLIVEAGTGTGKTLAYLIPSILSRKRVVISTGTKNLQEQLFYKDVPFLQKHLQRLLAGLAESKWHLGLSPFPESAFKPSTPHDRATGNTRPDRPFVPGLRRWPLVSVSH